jgi:hypothetical protein
MRINIGELRGFVREWRRRPRRKLLTAAGQWRTACSTWLLGLAGVTYGFQMLFREGASLWGRVQGVGLILASMTVLLILVLYILRPATLPDPDW